MRLLAVISMCTYLRGRAASSTVAANLGDGRALVLGYLSSPLPLANHLRRLREQMLLICILQIGSLFIPGGFSWPGVVCSS
jgi:hypothetical protein